MMDVWRHWSTTKHGRCWGKRYLRWHPEPCYDWVHHWWKGGGGRKVGPDEKKGSKRLMRREGRSPSVQLKCRRLTTRGQQSIKYRSLDPGQKKSMTDMSHTAKQKTEKKPHSSSERKGRDWLRLALNWKTNSSFRVQNDQKYSIQYWHLNPTGEIFWKEGQLLRAWMTGCV